MREKLEQLTRDYFDAFCKADGLLLSEMLSNDVFLRDWDILSVGKSDVINVMKSIVTSHSLVTIYVNRMIVDTDKKIVSAVIEIILSKEDTMEVKVKVVDVIKFTDDFKIEFIDAYKQ